MPNARASTFESGSPSVLLYKQERLAILMILGELDQPGLSVFLAHAGLPQIQIFSAATHPAPKIALDFLNWLDGNAASLLPTIQGLLVQFGQHEMAAVLQGAAARASAVGATAATGWPSQAVLISGVPMINRAPLRQVLQDHVDEHGSAPPVVMVDGPPGSGRSHSWFLIQHVAREAGIEAIKVDLTAPVLEQQTLPNIARLLVRRMRIAQHVTEPTTVAATPETVAERWAEEVSSAWTARAPQRLMWVVLDSLDRPLPPEVQRFVCALAARRLSHDMMDCVFFFLGAGQDYGVDDPRRLIARETLAVFLAHEIDQAARALAAIGRSQLTADQLDQRIADITALLAAGTPREICAGVHARLADLRVEVAA
jgi:hypothetical protein